jgi:hypothetical protein
MTDEQDFTPTPEFEKQRKSRNLAIGISLAAFVLLVFVVTIVRLGPGILDRPL